MPALIAGTSAGSVVGALYASGLSSFALQELSFSPVNATRKLGADIVIAVNISAQMDKNKGFDSLGNAINNALITMIQRRCRTVAEYVCKVAINARGGICH